MRSQELEVGGVDGHVVRAARIVGYGGVAAAVDPELIVVLAFRDMEQHLLMIPLDQHEVAASVQGHELLDDPLAVGAVVDDVAEEDQGVVLAGVDGVDERLQGGGASVDVADGVEAA